MEKGSDSKMEICSKHNGMRVFSVVTNLSFGKLTSLFIQNVDISLNGLL